jgi:hypothetical protein
VPAWDALAYCADAIRTMAGRATIHRFVFIMTLALQVCRPNRPGFTLRQPERAR